MVCCVIAAAIFGIVVQRFRSLTGGSAPPPATPRAVPAPELAARPLAAPPLTSSGSRLT